MFNSPKNINNAAKSVIQKINEEANTQKSIKLV